VRRSPASSGAPTVDRIALSRDQTAFLEVVEEPDQLAPVVREPVGDPPLGGAGPFVEQGQHGMVLRIEARRLERLLRALFHLEAEPLEQERGTRDELARRPEAFRSAGEWSD